MARELIGLLERAAAGHPGMDWGPRIFLARFLSAQGRREEAEAAFESILAREEAIADPYDRAKLHLFHGSHLVALGEYETAEHSIAAAVALVEDLRLGIFRSHPDGVIVGLIALYEAWGRPDEADRYRRLQQESNAVGFPHVR
jgi:hypothetical protein